ncbi:MAG: NAD(P)H-dependent oxidoreductase subunit E [Acidobacteriota bacterium]
MYGEAFEKKLEKQESRYPEDRKRANLMAALHAVQDEVGHVPEDAIHWLAERYGISSADVQGVIRFYTMFFEDKPGEHVIWVCRTFSCELMGGAKVMAAMEKALGCKVGESDPTGTFGLRWQECLAACDKAPCALIDKDMYECLTPETVELVLEHVKNGGGGARVEGEKLVPLREGAVR